MALKTRVIRIGNSQGVRIPKTLLEQANLGEEVELEVSNGKLLIRPASNPRSGWGETFGKVTGVSEEKPEWSEFPNKWDVTDWKW
jgi:antitoxin MazE